MHPERVHFSFEAVSKGNEQEDSLKQVLELLMQLQRIDSQLADLESIKGDLPNQVKRLNLELTENELQHQTFEKKLDDYRKETGMTELEIKVLEGKQTKYKNQLYEVKTNREYDAVTHEIESVKIEISKKESRILELMEATEGTQKALKETLDQIGRLKNEYQLKNEDLEKKQAATEREVIALKDKRDKVVRFIEPKILSGYERIRNAKNGLAIVPVVRNACGGCHKTLPPQKVLEIREMDTLYLCEVCGRMLVWDEKISEQAA